LKIAKNSGLTGKSLTSFNEFQTFGAAWLNALDKNLVCAARDCVRLRKKCVVAGLDYNDVYVMTDYLVDQLPGLCMLLLLTWI